MDAFDEMYERIKLATHSRTQVQLAALLGIRQSSISDAKRRRSIPADWFIKLHDKYGVNIDWLRWEKGLMYSPNFPALAAGGQDGSAASIAALPDGEGGPATGFFFDAGASVLPREMGLADALTGGAAPYGSGKAAALREDAPDMGTPKGVLSRVLNTSCEYEEGEGMPDFSVHTYLVLPKSMTSDDTLVFFVESGGMEPTLRKGGCVGLSTSQQHLISGEVYGLLMPHEGVTFRRILQDSESGLFMLCFDRAGLPATRMSAKSLQAKILGKVLWTIQPV